MKTQTADFTVETIKGTATFHVYGIDRTSDDDQQFALDCERYAEICRPLVQKVIEDMNCSNSGYDKAVMSIEEWLADLDHDVRGYGEYGGVYREDESFDSFRIIGVDDEYVEGDWTRLYISQIGDYEVPQGHSNWKHDWLPVK